MPLSTYGLTQAKKLAKRFKGQEIDAIFSSELQRSRRTAEEIGKILCLPVIVDPHLNEMDFGMFEGLTFEEIIERHEDLWKLRERDKLKFTGHKGEALGHFRNRVMKSIKRIIYQFPKGNVIVVSHGGVNRMVICSFLGLDVKKSHNIQQETSCVNVLVVREPSNMRYVPKLMRVNDTFHLDKGAFPKILPTRQVV